MLFTKRSHHDKNFQSQLTNLLGFKPGNLAFYKRAFTHKSVSEEVKEGFKNSNERLEFLGDAVLDAIVANYFFQRFPLEEEGFLTMVKAKIVNRGYLNDLAVKMGVDTLLSANVKYKTKTIYGDALEALIGAVFLDKGFDKTEDFVVNRIIRPLTDVDELIETETNFKSRVLEYCQKHRYELSYEVEEIVHEKGNYYKAKLFINGKLEGEGAGKSKKRAEQEAASKFFEKHLDSDN